MSDFQQLVEYLNEQSNIKQVNNNAPNFVSIRCGVAKSIGRKQTNEIRNMGFDIGDIQTTQQGSKYNPTRVLQVWIYPEGSSELEV